jgi:drug/metabolite transporter (DMT)-like permease
MAITAGRLAVGAAVLLAFAWLTGRALPRRAATWRLVSAIAVLGNALPFFLISWGQQRIPSGLAGILMAVMPLAVLVLAHFLVPGERLTGRRLGGFLLGFAGVAVLTGPEALAALAGGPGGLVSRLAVLCGALCYAVSTILARRGAPEDAVTVSAGVMVVAAGLSGAAAAFSALASPHDAPMVAGVSPGAAIALLALGALSTGFATVVYFRLIALSGATFLSLINYLIPVYAVVLGALVFGERLPLSALGALVLILAGIVLARFRAAPREAARR